MALFESKIDGVIAPSRWLWVGKAGVGETLNAQYENWDRALLGATKWRNAAFIQSELGWTLCGHDRMLRDAAMRRFSLWLRLEEKATA